MERIRLAAAVVAAILAFAVSDVRAQDNKGDKKKDAPAEVGPLGLPTLANVKAKCKPTEDQTPKLETIYADAVKNEADTRKRAREQGTEKAQLDKFLEMAKSDAVNKVKDLLDAAQNKIFNELLKAAVPDPKKKK